MRNFADLEPYPRPLCNIGWHSWVFGTEPDYDINQRCKHCLKLRRDWGMPVLTWLSKRGLPRIHGCIWDAECRFHGAPLRVSLMWGKPDGAHGQLFVDLPDYMRDPFEDGRRTWSWGGVVVEHKRGSDYHHWSLRECLRGRE